jgi:hypothetical protein
MSNENKNFISNIFDIINKNILYVSLFSGFAGFLLGIFLVIIIYFVFLNKNNCTTDSKDQLIKNTLTKSLLSIDTIKPTPSNDDIKIAETKIIDIINNLNENQIKNFVYKQQLFFTYFSIYMINISPINIDFIQGDNKFTLTFGIQQEKEIINTKDNTIIENKHDAEKYLINDIAETIIKSFEYNNNMFVSSNDNIHYLELIWKPVLKPCFDYITSESINALSSSSSSLINNKIIIDFFKNKKSEY